MSDTVYTRTMIETVTGKFVDVANPQPSMFCLEDIAWSLSRMPRFGAHTVNILPYSVGQHCIVVAQLLRRAWTETSGGIHDSITSYFTTEKPDKDVLSYLNQPMPALVPLYGLLHDASEAYLMDLPSPVKQLPGLREAYLNVEDRIMASIMESFQLPWPMQPEVAKLVHWADLYARTIEAYHLMPSRGAWWPSGNKLALEGIQEFEEPKASADVFYQFKLTYQKLALDVKNSVNKSNPQLN